MTSEPIDALRQRLADEPPSPGELWLVGVSGGADSVFLLRALHSLRHEFGIRLAVGHYNHGWRGEESEGDARFVASLAEDLGLRCFEGRAPGPSEPRGPHAAAKALPASEEEARRQRHAFLEQARLESGAGRIALAHHADDQAETVLLNFLRGTGPAGLAGMRERSRDGRLFRPLLRVPGSEIRASVAAHGWEYREDSSNADTCRTRNALRHGLIPLLEERYNPSLRTSLAEGALAFREWVELVEAQADEALSAARRPDPGSILSLERSVLSKYTQAVRKFALGKALRESAALVGLTRAHLNSLERLCASKEGGKRISLPDRIEAAREGDRLVVYRACEPPPFESRALEVPGELALPEGPSIRARRMRPEGEPGPRPDRVWLDPRGLEGPLTVRRRMPGDRFEPWGLGAETKLKDFLIAARVPRRLRGHLWLLADSRNVLWVMGHRPSERLRLTRLPEEVIEIRLEPAALPRH